MRSGRKSEAQTPSPKKDRIKGSKVNPKGSASSAKSAKSIELSDSIITTLENKRDEYNKKHPNGKVTLGALKAVFRRGAGAFSSSHRPNMTRSGWAFARVNKFLLKKGGTKVKAAYVQDDDLMERGAILDSSCKTYISQNISILKTGYYLNLNEFSSMIDPYGQIPLNLNYTLVTYNSGNQDGLSLIDTINPINLQNELADILNIPLNNAQVVVGLYIEMGKKLKSISQIEGDNILVIDRDKLVCKSGKDDDLMEKVYEEGGDLGQEITCVNCGWSWNTNQSDASDKYICHKCWFDNRTFYDSDPIGKYHLGGDMSMHLAPNGKPSNLTHEQWHLVRTPEFKAWFGDWERLELLKIKDSGVDEVTLDNIAKDVSKVVDENGEPMVVYHGSANKFNVFDRKRVGENYRESERGGFFFTQKLNTAKNYARLHTNLENDGFVYYCFLNIKNPLVRNTNSEYYSPADRYDVSRDEYIRECFNGNFDGIIINGTKKDNLYVVNSSNKIKLADGRNTTFDVNNPDIRHEDGGLLKKAPSILKIAEKHHVDLETIQNALKDGIKREMEHTKNRNVARTIASHHLYESPKYYEKLKIMEKELNLDEHYEDIKKIYAIGGVVDPVLSFSTPTGEPSKLTYLQQILVRTSAFKNFFGDWEYAGKRFVESGRQEYEYLYRNVSKVIDKITLEPKVVYHGTRVDSEFYVFDVSQQSGDGRPYGYFAHNKEYSENFTTSSQRSMANAKPFLYKCFVNIRNPFYAMTSEYYNIQEDAQYWKNEIAKTIALDKYTNELDSNKLDKIKEVVESQIGKYIDDTFGMSEYSFWLLMARDKNKLFKYFLNNYRYDGIFYAEEFGGNYDVDNPSEFTEAVTIFEPSQVKLADGRNLNFDPMNVDIRYEKGGDTDNVEKTQKTSNIMGKRENLRNLLLGDKYAEGGEVVANKLKDGNDGKKGGYFEGRSHDDGGIKAYNKDTGQMIEVEGEEVIITKGAVKDPQKREFEGEMLTNREILSRINQSGGGVSFAEGGEMKSSSCGCSGKKYKYGGEMMDDYSIVKIMNRPFEIINDNFADARAFADMLVEKLK
jgi:hypothetical protein